MTKFTRDNIEDWDFRSYVSPLNPRQGRRRVELGVESFLTENFIEVLLVDHERLVILQSLLSKGFARLSDDRAEVWLEPLGTEVLPRLTRRRDLATTEGRLRRRVVKALVREWQKNGRLRMTILPPDMPEQFPGLYEHPVDGDSLRVPDEGAVPAEERGPPATQDAQAPGQASREHAGDDVRMASQQVYDRLNAEVAALGPDPSKKAVQRLVWEQGERAILERAILARIFQ